MTNPTTPPLPATPPAGSAFVTTREAAKALSISLRTAQLWVEAGILEAWKTSGGHRRISLASIERLRAGERPAIRASAPAPVASAPVPPAPAAAIASTRPRVLVVEDDKVLLKLYKTTIERWNLPVDVECAGNGYEALLAIGRNSPDLLVSDLRMPGMDGFQMMRALCTSHFREGMEIVVATSLTADEIAAEGGLPADVRVLHKPVPVADLRAILDGVLARRAVLLAAMREPSASATPSLHP